MSPPDAETTPLSRDVRARAASYAGVVFAYLAAVRNDPLTPIQLALFGVACAWSLGFEGRYRKPFFSQPLKIGLIAVGAGVFVAFVARGTEGNAELFANNIARFLFWNAVVFVLSRAKSEYDLWTLAIIELSLFMISGSFVRPAAFLPLLAASAACLVYTFFRVGFLRCGAAGEAQKGGAGVAALVFLFALEVAALAFLVFPRATFRGDRPGAAVPPAPLPPMGPDVASREERVGLPKNPDLLDLRTYHALQNDPRPALSVRIRDLQGRPVSPDLTPYLRGATLDLYENGEWRNAAERGLLRDGDDGRKDQWIDLPRRPPSGRLVVRQHIQAAPLAGSVAHLLPDVLRVGLPELRWQAEAGVLMMPAAPRAVVEYDAESALPPPGPPRLSRAPEASAALLRLPPGLERVRAEAKRLTAGLGDAQLDLKVNRLQHFLMRNGFAYKLDAFRPAPGVDPVEHFLERRSGFCVHYASALALLCRAGGVPARVATGFQLHDPREDGSFLVRLSDAHAWVEVWFGAEHGWRAYDATPSDGRRAAPPEGEPVASGDLRKDREKDPLKRWDQLVVDFGSDSQGETLRATFKAVGGFLARVGAVLVSPLVLGTLGGLAALALLAYLLLPSAQKRRLRQIAAGFKEQSSVDFYRDFLWAVSKRGLRKPAGLTPLEFAGQVKAVIADPDVDLITAKFYEQRYGGRTPSPDERRRIDAALERLSTTPR